ncbi:MAG: hypothetical protein COA40_07795 [Aequorivita sp.]|nr:MAG: hypothetical protein COA40_07795 [Aequorivita sp.]
MGKIKWIQDIDWKSKLIDLLIVIIGITIAFQLNNFNEANKAKTKESVYLKSFSEENSKNEASLTEALEFAQKTKNDIDSLKQTLLSKNYSSEEVKNLSVSMMSLSDFHPSTVTMENITESGDFELIGDFEYREKLIDVYNAYKTTSQLEAILADYVNEYVTPFFFENIRLRDFTFLQNNFIDNPVFETIVIGYDALLTQKINGYKENLEKLKGLNKL